MAVKIFLFLSVSLLALGRLTVYSPDSLRKEINPENGDFVSSISNFGLIPYGHSIIGHVWMDTTNMDGCKEYEKEFDGMFDPDTDPSPIVLVERGNCSFVTKVRNIEHAGGRLALIIDDKKAENVEKVIMIDDGNGNGIRIPSMLINYDEGKKLKDYILKDDHVSLMATFNMDRPDNRVEYDFWYTSSDDRALDFLRDF